MKEIDNNSIEEIDKITQDDYDFGCYVKFYKLEDEWWQEQKNIRENIGEFKEEMKKSDPDFVRDGRMNYLEPRIKNLLDDIWDVGCWISEAKQSGKFAGELAEKIHGKELKKKQEEYKRYYLEYGMLKGGLPLRENEITPEIIQACREAPIETFISARIISAGNGRKKTLCPFHAEKTPSFVIYPDNGFYCFGCNENGQNAIDFIIKKEGIDFLASVNYLRQYI